MSVNLSATEYIKSGSLIPATCTMSLRPEPLHHPASRAALGPQGMRHTGIAPSHCIEVRSKSLLSPWVLKPRYVFRRCPALIVRIHLFPREPSGRQFSKLWPAYSFTRRASCARTLFRMRNSLRENYSLRNSKIINLMSRVSQEIDHPRLMLISPAGR